MKTYILMFDSEATKGAETLELTEFTLKFGKRQSERKQRAVKWEL